MTKLIRKCVVAVAVCAALAFAEDGEFIKMGAKVAVGASGLRDMVPVALDGVDMPIEPAAQLSLGVYAALDLDVVTIVPEIQYTWYRQNSRRIELRPDALKKVGEVDIAIHALEFPLMLRCQLPKSMYFEAGPQVGVALYTSTTISNKIETDVIRDETGKEENANMFIYGPTIGIGLNMEEFAIFARGHIGLREYAENKAGYPWLMQVGFAWNFYGM